VIQQGPIRDCGRITGNSEVILELPASAFDQVRPPASSARWTCRAPGFREVWRQLPGHACISL